MKGDGRHVPYAVADRQFFTIYSQILTITPIYFSPINNSIIASRSLITSSNTQCSHQTIITTPLPRLLVNMRLSREQIAKLAHQLIYLFGSSLSLSKVSTYPPSLKLSQRIKISSSQNWNSFRTNHLLFWVKKKTVVMYRVKRESRKRSIEFRDRETVLQIWR